MPHFIKSLADVKEWGLKYFRSSTFYSNDLLVISQNKNFNEDVEVKVFSYLYFKANKSLVITLKVLLKISI